MSIKHSVVLVLLESSFWQIRQDIRRRSERFTALRMDMREVSRSLVIRNVARARVACIYIPNSQSTQLVTTPMAAQLAGCAEFSKCSVV
jgi:hypothetical protein